MFISHLPLLQAATWKGPNILVYINDSELVGGHSNWHMTPAFSLYNFTRQPTLVPLWLGSLQWWLSQHPPGAVPFCGMALIT
jgi:hypothetical protein